MHTVPVNFIDKKAPAVPGQAVQNRLYDVMAEQIFWAQFRNHSIRLNKKTRLLASKSAFAEKIRQDGVMVLDNLEFNDNKTKNLKSLLSTFDLPSKVLIVTDQISDNLRLASRNLHDVHVLSHRSLNVYEIMRNNKVFSLKKRLSHSWEKFSK
ncbi:MAG: hypothetical protein CM1200mP28_06830 [Deltaproteobacteria bacterium]|nr:MAG: hypothetical protein CM1200mP28_06830 [Deltaproteobacteria bacterium]